MNATTDSHEMDRALEPQGVDCSVLVPVLNEERDIVASVGAMLRQRFPGRLEFLLVDGGSTDGTRELLRALAGTDARIRLLENPGGVTPGSLNVALAHARGRWVARMDAHTEYPDEYLARGVERLRQGGTRWVSGPQVATGHDRVSRAVALALRTPLGYGGSRKWGATGDSAPTEYELDSGVFAGVWERETLLAYGGWDEQWLRNQDSEMAGRFLAGGDRLICLPAMAANYTPRSSLRSLWRQYLQYGEYRAKTAAAHPRTMRRSHLLPPGLVLTGVAAMVPGGRLSRVARAGLCVYAAALVAAGIRVAGDAEQPLDAGLVPVVLAIMHLAYGVGTMRGAVRHDPPLGAVAGALGFTGLAVRLAPPPREVYAPSLRRGATAK
jgi:succinoglycan biosynthesis protein ExoA